MPQAVEQASSASAAYTSTVLITGGSSGLGLELSLQLANAEPSTLVIVTSRSPPPAPPNGEEAPPNIQYIPLDLTTRDAVRTFAADFLSTSEVYPRIKALVLNAAYQNSPAFEAVEEDTGVEKDMAINHLNQALLFFLLKDRLTPDARIVFVSSGGHDTEYGKTPPPYFPTDQPEKAGHPDRFKGDESYTEAMRRYCLSKLAQLLFAYALDRRAHEGGPGRGWAILAFDPGVMASGLHRWRTGIVGWLFMATLRSSLTRWVLPDLQPATTVAGALKKVLTDNEYGSMSGNYVRSLDGKAVPSSVQSREVHCQDVTWDWTVKELAKDATEAATFNQL